MAGKVGILALQGDFDSHRAVLERLGLKTTLVKKPAELSALSGLVLPGGESTTLLKLLDDEFRETLRQVVAKGMPTFATCAGLILLAKRVTNPGQDSFGALDVDVERNAYGRQVDSFIEPELTMTESGKRFAEAQLNGSTPSASREGVFIRAPKITRLGSKVESLLICGSDPVLVKQDNVLAATFHPELSAGTSLVHALFLKMLPA